MDLVSDEAMEGGMKSLIIWPAIVLALGIWWSWGPKAETAPEAGTLPPAGQVVLNAPVNPVVPATVQPAPPNPAAQPAGPGHWVWIPDKGPGSAGGWNIPPHP